MANALDPIHTGGFSFGHQNGSIDQAALMKSVIQKQSSMGSNPRKLRYGTSKQYF
jgi:hypothetical protein